MTVQQETSIHVLMSQTGLLFKTTARGATPPVALLGRGSRAHPKLLDLDAAGRLDEPA